MGDLGSLLTGMMIGLGFLASGSFLSILLYGDNEHYKTLTRVSVFLLVMSVSIFSLAVVILAVASAVSG